MVYVVYLLIPTSNHNVWHLRELHLVLYIFWFLHQTTTGICSVCVIQSCISFDSYIKPQRCRLWVGACRVVYLLIPTSNHNWRVARKGLGMLYIFWFLHQTTTSSCSGSSCWSCISFDSYIKPQLYFKSDLYPEGCISFDSYIKPQRWLSMANFGGGCISFDSYIKPQLVRPHEQWWWVVYLLIPTSNHNRRNTLQVVSGVVYLLIPTSNHNCRSRLPWGTWLYIFWFLHQTTTVSQSYKNDDGCISFDSYIKPQPESQKVIKRAGCISFDSYIKPQPSS